MILGDPQIYEVKEGDWLSKLAQKHYNDVDLWEELALINMAPNPDYILPGEKILMTYGFKEADNHNFDKGQLL